MIHFNLLHRRIHKKELFIVFYFEAAITFTLQGTKKSSIDSCDKYMAFKICSQKYCALKENELNFNLAL